MAWFYNLSCVECIKVRYFALKELHVSHNECRKALSFNESNSLSSKPSFLEIVSWYGIGARASPSTQKDL